jgi:hypothetical protein
MLGLRTHSSHSIHDRIGAERKPSPYGRPRKPSRPWIDEAHELQTRLQLSQPQPSASGLPQRQAPSQQPVMMTEKKELNARVVRKLDFILLPFLSIFFLASSLDRSNVGNAESANFTEDAGLDPQDLNTSVAIFFAVFVSLQPLGAALGRKYGMVRFVPACMLVWGLCTAMHIWVRNKWELIALRTIIGVLEGRTAVASP